MKVDGSGSHFTHKQRQTHDYGLPKELLVGIFQYLPLKGLCSTSLVCKSWTAASKDPSLLFHLYLQILKEVIPSAKNTKPVKDGVNSFTLKSYALTFVKNPDESIKIVDKVFFDQIYEIDFPKVLEEVSLKWNFFDWIPPTQKDWLSSENPDAYAYEYPAVSGSIDKDNELNHLSISIGGVLLKICNHALAPQYKRIIDSIHADSTELMEQRCRYKELKKTAE